MGVYLILLISSDEFSFIHIKSTFPTRTYDYVGYLLTYTNDWKSCYTNCWASRFTVKHVVRDQFPQVDWSVLQGKNGVSHISLLISS